MYKVEIFCMDPPYTEPGYMEQSDTLYERKVDADLAMYQAAIQELDSLNQPDVDFTPRTNIFVPIRDYEVIGVKYDLAIVLWDGAKESDQVGVKGYRQFVTGYRVVWQVSSDVDRFNKKLRDTYGDEVLVQVKSVLGLTPDEEDASVEEDHEVFCYTTRFGNSSYYATAEKAYLEAVDYLECPIPY